jgi:carbonic anhydrase
MGPLTTIVAAETEADLGHVRALFTEYAGLLEVRHRALCVQDFAQEVANLPGAYGPLHGRLLLAAVGGAVAGCVGLRRWADGVGEMKRLYVRPAFRGRGLGRALTAAAVEGARHLGYGRLRLDTLPAMTEALTLYRSLGFVPIAPFGDAPAPDALYLERALT